MIENQLTKGVGNIRLNVRAAPSNITGIARLDVRPHLCTDHRVDAVRTNQEFALRAVAIREVGDDAPGVLLEVAQVLSSMVLFGGQSLPQRSIDAVPGRSERKYWNLGSYIPDSSSRILDRTRAMAVRPSSIPALLRTVASSPRVPRPAPRPLRSAAERSKTPTSQPMDRSKFAANKPPSDPPMISARGGRKSASSPAEPILLCSFHRNVCRLDDLAPPLSLALDELCCLRGRTADRGGGKILQAGGYGRIAQYLCDGGR